MGHRIKFNESAFYVLNTKDPFWIVCVRARSNKNEFIWKVSCLRIVHFTCLLPLCPSFFHSLALSFHRSLSVPYMWAWSTRCKRTTNPTIFFNEWRHNTALLTHSPVFDRWSSSNDVSLWCYSRLWNKSNCEKSFCVCIRSKLVRDLLCVIVLIEYVVVIYGVY